MHGVINRAVADIYEVPYSVKQTSYGAVLTIADEALYGQEFTLLDNNIYRDGVTDRERGGKDITYDGNDFIKIRTFYNYEGYVRRSEVILYDEWDSKESRSASGSAWGSECSFRKLWVCAAYADVLSGTKVSSQRLISLTRGSIICTDGMKDGGYLRVFLNDNSTGYIRSSFVVPYNEPTTEPDICDFNECSFRKSVVDTAVSYLGTQYRWGGKTPLGIDCSGLTSMSYLLNGIVIYRDAKLKESFPVHEIALSDIKPGDLMYFPGHTAMYIGNCEYIHSTAREGSDGVVINSLSGTSPCYREDLANTLTAVGSIF